ncbi:hypothetical protein QBC39DRAFT_358069 [Podospora conica]|nr:hypothetical protein QBC39DRAFT_358069 [Schizothecium conicum]
MASSPGAGPSRPPGYPGGYLRPIKMTKQFDRASKLEQYPLDLLEKDTTGANVLRMRAGEEGWSLGTISDGKTTWHKGKFCRDGKWFSIALPIEYIRVGQQYREVSEQIRNYLTEIASTRPLVTAIDRSRLETWASEGDSTVDKFVKCLWLELRDMSRLKELGLKDDLANKIFEPNDPQAFMDNVDALCKVIHPRFRHALEQPTLKIATLLSECLHVHDAPYDTDDVTIYVHIMTHLDTTHNNVENAAIYVGRSNNVKRRVGEHELRIEKEREADPGDTPATQKPGHYDIAPLTPPDHSHWVAAVSADMVYEFQRVNLGAFLACEMLEQTMIILLGSFAPWLIADDAEGSPTGWVIRAKTMNGAAERVRTRTGIPFPCAWPSVRGTNVTCPIFMVYAGAVYEGPASEVQAIYIPSPAHRPTSPGRHVYRFPRRFYSTKKGGEVRQVGTSLTSHVGGGKAHKLKIHVPLPIVPVITESIDPRFKDEQGGLWVTLAFEVMDNNAPHPAPYLGFPAIGPYKDFGAPNCLGLRIEWMDAKTKKVLSLPLASSRRVASAFNLELAKGVGTKWLRAFADFTGIINTLRGQKFSNPNATFSGYVSFGHGPPIVRMLDFNFMEQTVALRTIEVTGVPRPEPANFRANRDLLKTLVGPPESGTILIYPPGGAVNHMYAITSQSQSNAVKETKVTGNVQCDTCTLVKHLGQHRQEAIIKCSARPGKDSCVPCNLLVRPCTFSSRAKLSQGWTGASQPPKSFTPHPIPKITTGPLRFLVFHRAVRKDEYTPTEVSLVGWEMMNDVARAMEADAEDDKDGEGDDEVESADEEEDDDEE